MSFCGYIFTIFVVIYFQISCKMGGTRIQTRNRSGSLVALLLSHPTDMFWQLEKAKTPDKKCFKDVVESVMNAVKVQFKKTSSELVLIFDRSIKQKKHGL